MKTTLLKILPLAAALLMVGCYHPKSLESQRSAMEKTDPPSGVGDPGSFGGMADGTGGTQTSTTYATSSKPVTDPMATTADGKAARFAHPEDNESVSANPTTTPPVTGSQGAPGTKPSTGSGVPVTRSVR